MKIDFYDLLDQYEETEIMPNTKCRIAPDRIISSTKKKLVHKRNLRLVRIAAIAAVLVLCLGTTVLATTDVLGTVINYMRSSVDKDFGGNGKDGPDIVSTVSAGTDLNISLYNGDAVFLTNGEGNWYFTEGQMVDILVEIDTSGVRSENNAGYGVYYGYVRCDAEGNALEQNRIYSEQTFERSACHFEVPEDGYYYFFFLHVSSDIYELDTFTVELAE